jgi:hypothetical protein
MVILLATVSCAAEGLTPSKALTPVNMVSFRAYDYGFDGPTTIGAGLTTIRMTNSGHDLHHIQLVRLPAGRSEQDFMEALKSNLTPPAWVSLAGGPNAVIPGEEASATIHLEEGQYLLICWIPDKKGVAHVSLGMSRPLLVTAAVNPLAASPQSDLSVRLVDFGFSLSQPLKAGSRTLEVANQGSERHELVVVQLAPGASVKDFAAAFEPGASVRLLGNPSAV